MENRQREEKELISGAKSLGLELSQSQFGLLLRYAELVREWNQRINLVSRKDIGNLVSGHIVDSLAGVPVLKKLLHGVFSPRVMDLGSGGGLPGIPLKICLPEIDLTLVESTKKKARFLETAVRELGLDGVLVVDRHSRELEKDPENRAKYDLVLARAVAELRDLVALAFPFLGPGGWLVAYKGLRTGDEIAGARSAVKKLGGEIEENPLIALPGTEKARHIVVVRKVK